MGNELFDLRAVRQGKIPVATYDDATLAQMRRHPQSDIALSAFRDRDVRQWSRWQEISLGAADVCCASTSWAVESLVADYGIAGDRARAVGIGHRSRAQSPTAGRDWTKPRLLFVGLDWRRKNGDAVVSAFRQLRRQFPEAELHLVGRHPAIDVPGVNCHGHLRKDDPGDQQRLDELYASATMFVLPSLFEPAGIAYLEAASAGLPVIATTEGGAKDLLPGTAICVPPNDPSALLEAMLRCCDPHTAASIGALGAEFAAGCTWRDVAGGIAAALGAAPPVDQ
jgi:glycosyltransferase involved in cell wall biosynthesis